MTYEVHIRHFLISQKESIMIVLAPLKKIPTQDSKIKIFLKIFRALTDEEDNMPICKISNPSFKICLEATSEDQAAKVETEEV